MIARDNEYILSLIDQYQNKFKANEATVSSVLIKQLNSDQDVFDRKNSVGHITASGLVIDPEADKILLINHKFLKMWLQPGGHVEARGEIYKEAMREVAEETALKNFELHEWHRGLSSLDVPFSIDTHEIPESVKKAEPKHLHHDFTYVFVGSSKQSLTNQVEEVSAAKWFKTSEVAGLKTDIQKFILRLSKHIN